LRHAECRIRTRPAYPRNLLVKHPRLCPTLRATPVPTMYDCVSEPRRPLPVNGAATTAEISPLVRPASGAGRVSDIDASHPTVVTVAAIAVVPPGAIACSS